MAEKKRSSLLSPTLNSIAETASEILLKLPEFMAAMGGDEDSVFDGLRTIDSELTEILDYMDQKIAES